MGDTSEALFSPVCLYTNSVLCLRSNLSSRELTTLSQNRKTLEPVFIPRMSPCRHSVLMRSPRHSLSVCFNPVKTARHGKPPSDCVSCSATAKLGRQTLTPGNLNFQRQQVEKKPVCCVCRRKWCQMWFICWENASYKSQHASVFVWDFFFSAFGAEIACFAALNYCWFYSQEFVPFLTRMSRGRSSALWILRAALDLCLGFLACPGWMTLCKGRHLLHPLKRSGGG